VADGLINPKYRDAPR